MQSCNHLNQNEYKTILILFKENLYFLFIKESTQAFITAEQILGILSSHL